MNGFLQKTNLIHVTEYSLTLAFESVQPEHRGNEFRLILFCNIYHLDYDLLFPL
jgi:hypothetical protein